MAYNSSSSAFSATTTSSFSLSTTPSSSQGWRASCLGDELSGVEDEDHRRNRRPRPGPSLQVQDRGTPQLFGRSQADDDRGACADGSRQQQRRQQQLVATGVVRVEIPVEDVVDVSLLPKDASAIAARSALADYVARTLLWTSDPTIQGNSRDEEAAHVSDRNSSEQQQAQQQPQQQHHSSYSFRIEPLDQTSHRDLGGDSSSYQRTGLRRRRHRHARRAQLPPFVLDRTDIYCCRGRRRHRGTDDGHDNEDKAEGNLFVHVHVRVGAFREMNATAPNNNVDTDDDDATLRDRLSMAALRHMQQWVQRHGNSPEMLRHIATAVFQERLRHQLEGNDGDNTGDRAVAFVANGSILPRKNGNSTLPMASPPALPFEAPMDSPMTATVHVPMGPLARYLQIPAQQGGDPSTSLRNGSNVVSVTGLLIPRGVTLIVGGGYHGKSTLLRALSVGVYNKIPGDGREFCVTTTSAVSIRAEDGRYVSNCNVSAFITNLPKIQPVIPSAEQSTEVEALPSTDEVTSKRSATQHFSTGEASGSTSQAANVCEAIELGATALLVDEDVSAANFMARDGRMRSLVADESITPLLYRVNGMYAALGISSVVVVGGVGDWLDVPDAVVLMQNYRCHDATAKARSISRQFSHGHVQYGGRGVVHRLPWDKSGSSVPLPVDAPPPKHTPIPRRPSDAFCRLMNRQRTAVRLLDGSDAFALDPLESDEVDEDGDSRMEADDATHCKSDVLDAEDDDGEYVVDMSRCEQLVGKKRQLYGCGACVLHVLELALQHPNAGMADLLRKLDEHLDEHGIASLVKNEWGDTSCVERLGYAYRPRRFEVGQALTRLRGIRFNEIDVEDDGSEAAAIAEAERKKREMLELWNSRRGKNKT